MLKRMVLVTMSVFGAASMAVAGSPITTITATTPRLRRLERPVVQVKKPALIPKVPKVGTNMRVRGQQSGTQPRIRELPGHRGRVSSSHHLMVPQRIVPVVKEARLPDLVIRTAAIHPAEVCRSGAPVLYVTARVVNIGRGASAAKPSVGMVQARNTGGVNWGNGHGLPALAPGASASVRFPIYYLQSNPGYMRGTHAFKLTVNAGRWVRESNYVNNGFRPVRVTLPRDFCGGAKSSAQSGIPNQRTALVEGMVSSGLRKPPPRLRVIRISSKIGDKCPDPNKFLTNNMASVNATIYNDGGPLTRDQSGVTHVSVKEFGGAELGSGGIRVPPLAHGQQVVVKIPVYVMRRLVRELPGTHKLSMSILVGTKRTSYAMKLTFPPGYCQPKTGSFTHGKMPDLIPQVSNPFNGIIKVRNIGGATAGASKLTVNCEKIGGGFVSAGDCPSTPALDSLPTDSSGALLESVPALHVGQVYTISLPVQGLKWSKGKYRFTYKADATHAVAESNESNNVKTMVRQR